MEYTIVETSNASELCITVSCLISDGWKTVGGVAISHSYIDHIGKFGQPGHRETISNYAQAMINEETNNA